LKLTVDMYGRIKLKSAKRPLPNRPVSVEPLRG
jgi:hypothetical protein